LAGGADNGRGSSQREVILPPGTGFVIIMTASVAGPPGAAHVKDFRTLQGIQGGRARKQQEGQAEGYSGIGDL
jgi:hypothetical protein